MSASLVGSEMCIRDRALSERSDTSGLPLPEVQKALNSVFSFAARGTRTSVSSEFSEFRTGFQRTRNSDGELAWCLDSKLWGMAWLERVCTKK
eukprot:15449362-Alexandrium_andersonii.AAC.1